MLSGDQRKLAAMARRAPRNLAELAAANLIASDPKLGQLRAAVKGAQAIATVVALGVVARERAYGDWPSQADYAGYWEISERNAQREWAHFRRAFPHEDSPDRLARVLLEKHGTELVEGGAGFAFALPVQGLLTPA